PGHRSPKASWNPGTSAPGDSNRSVPIDGKVIEVEMRNLELVTTLNRREFLKAILLGAPLGIPSIRLVHGSERAEQLPPIRQITRGPKFHWFGYYDKFQFSA